MQITRNTEETAPPTERLVHGNGLHRHRRTPSEPSRMAAASVHFSPGARTAWQTHPSAKPSMSPRATAYASVEAGQSRSSVPAIASSSSPARTGAAQTAS
jgi:hypothetical protein